MRLLVVFAHPVEESFTAAIHRLVLEVLAEGGHEAKTSISTPAASIR